MTDFYTPEFREETFTRNGQSKTFRAMELSGDAAERLFDIRGRNGKTDPEKMKGLDARIVAAAVKEFDPETENETDIDIEQARKMPLKLRRELVRLAMDANGMSDADKDATDQD